MQIEESKRESTHMEYSIGDVAKLIGTSKEAIRYFERLGYINPPEKTESGYRFYDVYTSGILRWLRMYRGYGFTLHEAGALVQASDSAQVSEALKPGVDRLKKKIAFLQRTERSLEELIAEMETAPARQDQIVLDMRPALYRISFEYRDNFYFKKYSRTYLEHWHSQVPLVKSTPLFHYKDILSGEYLLDTGLGIFEKDLFDHEILNGNVQYYPEQPCYRAVFYSFPEEGDRSIRTLLDAMEENGHELAGDIITRPVALWLEEGKPRYYHEYFAPYREKNT